MAVRLALPVTGERFRLEESAATGRIDILRINSGDPVGSAVVEWDNEEAHIASLVVDEPHRRYGAGSEAAALLIDALVASGAKRVTSWAPPDIGLAAYFWYRMGLHALHGPGPGGGILYELNPAER